MNSTKELLYSAYSYILSSKVASDNTWNEVQLLDTA